jgi:hypothetical protein
VSEAERNSGVEEVITTRVSGATHRHDLGVPTKVRGGAEIAVRGAVHLDNLEVALGTTGQG